jgi:hypothetical protein
MARDVSPRMCRRCPLRLGTRKGGKGPVLSAFLLRDKARVVGLWLLHVSPRTCLWLPSALRDKEGESLCACCFGTTDKAVDKAVDRRQALRIAAASRGTKAGRGGLNTPLCLLLLGKVTASPSCEASEKAQCSLDRDNGQGSWTGGRRSGSRQLVVGRMRAEAASTPPSV